MSKEKNPTFSALAALKKIQKFVDKEAKRTKVRHQKSVTTKTAYSEQYDVGLDVGAYEQASAMRYTIHKIIADEL